jgi:hypothetical protein
LRNAKYIFSRQQLGDGFCLDGGGGYETCTTEHLA